MRSMLTVMVVLAMGAACPLTANVFEDDFEAYTLGGDPGTPPVGQAWVLEQQQYATNIRIGDAGGSNSLACERASVQSQAPNARAQLTAQGTADITGQTVTISMRVLKPFKNNSRALAYFQAFNNGNRAVNVFLQDNGNVDYFDGAAVQSTGLTYAVGAWQDFAIEVDYSAQTYTVLINGATTAGATDIAMENGESSMELFSIGSGKGGTVWLDDLVITPEPTTMALLAGGMVLGLIRRRR